MYVGAEEARVTRVAEGRTGDIEIVVIDTADELVIVQDVHLVGGR
jgi:hypothetical protein